VDKTADFELASALEQNMGAQDVGLGELDGVSEGAVNVSLGGEMHDCVDREGLHDVGDKLDVEDAVFDEFEVGFALGLEEILHIGAVIEAVEAHEKDVWVFVDKEVAHMGADEASAAGDQDLGGDVRLAIGRHWDVTESDASLRRPSSDRPTNLETFPGKRYSGSQ
jgi:hypothetical protein